MKTEYRAGMLADALIEACTDLGVARSNLRYEVTTPLGSSPVCILVDVAASKANSAPAPSPKASRGPSAAEPKVLAAFRKTMAKHDGKYLSNDVFPHTTSSERGTIFHAFAELTQLALDFSGALEMSSDDVDNWLSDHSLERGWKRRWPHMVPLALFVEGGVDDDDEEEEEESATDVAEMLCADTRTDDVAVVLFVREGSFLPVKASLADFIACLVSVHPPPKT